ncbi:MAG: DUF4239 domain-containing protein [Edaphobacter sp.]
MLSNFQDALLIILTVVCSLLVMVTLNWVWPRDQRKAHNDLIGWQLNVLGTMYAVIIGFMLYTVWTDFGTASMNTTAEANAIVNIHRLAAGLPLEQQEAMRQHAQDYVGAVIYRGWPAMSRGEVSTESSEISRKMWHTLMSIQSPTPTQVIAEDHALYELSTLTEHRQMRQLAVSSKLPSILWCVLFLGGALTIFSACLFGQENVVLHGIQVFALSFLISLVLVAIADINRPFQGAVHVSDAAFRRAQISMQPQ